MNFNKQKSDIRIGLGLLLLIIITSAVYGNHFDNSFHFDDSHTIVNNLSIRDINNWPSFFKDGTTFSTLPSNQSYRPVVTLLNSIDYHISGKQEPDPFVFHISIFTSFILLGLFFFLVLRALLDSASPSRYNAWVSLFVTGWLWLHTANAETVNYIIARSDSFSTLLVVVAFAIYLCLPVQRKYCLYMLPVVAGFFTKEPAVLFVPLLFFYKLFFEADLTPTNALKYHHKTLAVLKQLAVPILISAVVFLVYKSKTPVSWTPGGTDWSSYVLTQPYVIFHYFKNFIVPVELVVDTDWKPVNSLAHPWVIIGFVFIISLIVIACLAGRKREYRLIAFGIFWYLIALAPTSLIPFAEVMNDHRTFFPYIGLFIAFACAVRNLLLNNQVLLKSRSVGYAVAIFAFMVLTLNAYGTIIRNQVWSTESTLWKEATEKAPENGRAWMNYGLSLMAVGDYSGAEACFMKALHLWPSYAYVYINMGVLKSATDNAQQAEHYFSKALVLDPNNPSSYSFYADHLIKIQRFSDAQKLIAKGLLISPQHPELNVQADKLRQLQGAGNPNSSDEVQVDLAADYLNRSLEHYNNRRFDACIELAYKALEVKPDYDLAYNNICAAYNQLGNWDKAIEAGRKGLAVNPNNELLNRNLQESYRGKESGVIR